MTGGRTPNAGGPWLWRYVILRRTVQLLVLVLFVGTVERGWEVAGAPLLSGNLSATELRGTIPLADPFAALQMLFTGRLLAQRVLVGAVIVLVFFGVVGGRVFCSWVCPINPVTDLAGWLRDRIGLRRGLAPSRGVRYWLLGLALLLSSLTGVAAFEWISPIGMAHRGLIFGMGLGWVAVLAVFLFDLVVARHGWCGHLCPLGAFYGMLGRTAQLRVRYDAASCTHCGDCLVVCPEPHVLDFKRAAREGMIVSGDCTNCGRCTPVCPEGSLSFGLRGRRRTVMKSRIVVCVALAAIVGVFGVALADKAVEDNKLGLSKESVFATPDPIVAKVKGGQPGENASLGAYFSGSPPMIPHQVEGMMPIRVNENLCLDCHMLPDQIGQQAGEGEPTPMPASHFTDRRSDPGKVVRKTSGARFTCTQCHATQADAEPLVVNTYRQ